MAEERHQPVGRAEQIDRVPRRRRVDDDQVPLAARPQLVQPLDRHVLLRAGQRTGDAAVDRVGEDRLRPLLVAGPVDDHPVERATRASSICAHSEPVAAGGTDHLARLVRPGAVDAERVGEPPRRVDGDHDDPPTGVGRCERERRRRGGLADAARPARDDQRRVVQHAASPVIACHPVESGALGTIGSTASASASTSRWCGSRRATGSRGRCTRGSGSASSRRANCARCASSRACPKRTDVVERALRGRRQRDPLLLGCGRGGHRQARPLGPARVHDQRRERQAEVVLEVERQLDRLVDRASPRAA